MAIERAHGCEHDCDGWVQEAAEGGNEGGGEGEKKEAPGVQLRFVREKKVRGEGCTKDLASSGSG